MANTAPPPTKTVTLTIHGRELLALAGGVRGGAPLDGIQRGGPSPRPEGGASP